MKSSSNLYSTKLLNWSKITKKEFKQHWISLLKWLQLLNTTTNNLYPLNNANTKKLTIVNSKDTLQPITWIVCSWLLISSWKRLFLGIIRLLRMDSSMRISKWKQLRNIYFLFFSYCIRSCVLILLGKNIVINKIT